MKSPAPTTSPRPAVHLHIERLVLEGLELTPAEAARFEAALTGELPRHFAGVPAGSWTAAALARLQAAPIQFNASQPPAGLAAAVAQSVFASVAPVTSHALGGQTGTTF